MQIPYKENTRVDELSRVDSSDPKTTKRILVEVLNRSDTIEREVMIIDVLDWKSPIIDYLRSPIVETNSQLAKLRIQSARYILIEDILYKKSFSLPYLQCLGPNKAQYALRKIHEGICGQYMGDRSF